MEPVNTKRGSLTIFFAVTVIFVSFIAGFFVYQNQKLASRIQELSKSIPTPAQEASPTPTPDPTADWETYLNTTYRYTIKYPRNLLTQVLAAGAGTKTAPPDARHIYIFDGQSKEPYLERYMEIQHFNLKSQASAGVSNEFDVYYYEDPIQKGIIEIYVSKNESRKVVANQILSTFKFTDNKEVKNPKDICVSHYGTWLEEYKECEIGTSTIRLTQEQCETAGGTYKVCTSPCRHDPPGQKVCATVCVPVCNF